MRALIRDQADNTLIAAEISVVSYDPLRKCLHLDLVDGKNIIYIPFISGVIAEAIASTMYSSGSMDLSRYDAWCNEKPDCEIQTENSQDDTIHEGMYSRNKRMGHVMRENVTIP